MADPSLPEPAPLFSLTQIQHLMRVEFSRAQRYGYPLAVLVIEVDDLARRRDEHGFEARQDALAATEELLQRTTRSCDFLGRLVDDRFTAVLPHTRAEGAARTAERLLAAAREVELTRPPLPLTLSVGYATFEDDDMLFFDALVDAAEAALAEARAAGGNRAVARDVAQDGGRRASGEPRPDGGR